MVIANRPNFFQKLTFKLQQVLFAQSEVHPGIFISFVVLKQLQLLEFPESTTWLFFLGLGYLGLALMNSYFMYTASVTLTLGSFLPYNIFMGILGINKKWKLCLFSFVLVFYLPTQNSQFQNVLIGLYSGFICFSIYRQMLFQTLTNNKWFFVIFFTLFFVNCYCFILQNLVQIQTILIYKMIIVPILACLGHTVIKKHMQQISNDNILQIKNVGIWLQKIQMLEQIIEKDQKNIKCLIQCHKQKCNKIECFCSKFDHILLLENDHKNLQILNKQFINGLFVEFIENKMNQNDDRVYLLHKYVQFLIDCGQYVRAISTFGYLDVNNMGYFNKCDNFRIKQRLRKVYGDFAYFDDEDIRMRHFYDYDMKVGYVIKQIRQIMMDKILFWVEVCKQSSELTNLQFLGVKVIDRIQNLHEYFTYEMKITQQILQYYKCTYIYVSYLLLTTNYIEYANCLIKRCQKMLAQKKGGGIMVGQEYGLFLEIVENKQKCVDYVYGLQIKNLCKSLSLHLKMQKNDLINSNLNELIPDEFSKIHCQSFDKFIKMNNFQKKESEFLDKSLQLPFKVNNDYVSFLNTSSSLRFDAIKNCLNVQVLLKKVSHGSVNFIVNLQGKLVYRENQHYKDFVNQEIVKSTILGMKLQYQSHRNVDKAVVKSEDDDHQFSLSFQPLFCEKLFKPLIKVVVKSDLFKNEKHRIQNYDNAQKIKQLQNPNVSQQQNDSQSSTASRKDSIENVLTVLSQTNSLKIEPFLGLVLLLFGIMVAICFYILKDNFKIWHAQKYSSLPSFTLICLINMKDIFNTVISWRYDSVRKFQNQTSMNKLLTSLYDGKTVYQVRGAKFVQLFQKQSNIYNNFILGTNNLINIELKQQLKRTITMQSKQNKVIAKNMTMQSIIYNFLVSIRHIASGYYFPKLMLSFGYLPTFYYEIEVIILRLRDKIKGQFSNKKRDNIITFCLCSFVFMLFVIPICWFNTHNKKKHQQIYNLLVCIQSNFIVNEIKKLEIIQKEFFIYSNFGNGSESVKQVTSLFGIGSEKKRESINQQKLISAGIETSNLSLNPNNPKNSFKSISCLDSIKIRKRGGDLITSSIPMCSKHLLLSRYIPVTFIIIFITILLSTFINKYQFMTRMTDQFEQNYLAMDKVENISLSLLLSKIYVDDYKLDAKRTFLGQDLQQWLRKYIQEYRSISEYQYGVDTSVKECLDNILMCRTQYSNVLRETFVKKSIWNAYQYKRIYLRNQSYQNFHNLQKSRFQLIFSQQLLDRNTEDDYKRFYSSFEYLEHERTLFKIRERNIFKVFWVFFSFFIIFSVSFTIYVKEKYVKEVSLLSLLNKEMLWNNKTIESFVQRLAKSLR